MKKKLGLLALSLPAAFAVGCNLDTGISLTWSTSVCTATNAFIRVSGTSSSGAAARESCGATSMTSCVAGSQVINCSAGAVTILNWASGIWTIKVDLIAGTDTNGASPVATSYLACKTVTEGQTTNLGSVTLSSVESAPSSCSGGGGADAGADAGTPAATTVSLSFTFGGTSNTSCSAADLTGTPGVSAQCRGLRYKLTCGSNIFRNTNGDSTPTADQVTACGSTATASNSNFAGSGSCTLEAQLVSSTAACSGSAPTSWEHCDYYQTSNVTVTASQANSLSLDLIKQTNPTPCPLTKPW